MKTIFKFAALTVMMFAVSVCAFSATAENLVRGIIGPVTSNTNWSGYSLLGQIPGAGLIPITSTTTTFTSDSRQARRRTSTILFSTRLREAA